MDRNDIAKAVTGEPEHTLLPGPESQPAEAGVSPPGTEGSSVASGPTPGGSGSPAPEGSQRTEPGEEKTSADPFAGAQLADLLQHPVLGPQLQSWADRSAAAQVRAALEREGVAAQQRAAQNAQMAQWAAYFQGMDREELAEALTDPETFQAYSAVQQWQQQQQAAHNQIQVAAQAKVQAYAEQIRAIDALMQEAKLPKEKAAALDPQRYTHLGEAGISVWTNDVLQAIVDHQASQRIEAELNKRWEAFKQEKLAELDKSIRTPTGPTSPSAPLPDLIATDSQVLVEAALRARPPDRSRTN